MAIYIGILILTVLLGFVMRPNSGTRRKRNYMVIVFGLITIISALRKYSVGKDLGAHYYNTFLRIKDLPWKSAIASTSYEKGFVAFLKLVGSIFENPQWMIVINSIFIFVIIGWFIYKNSEDVVLSSILFIACNTWFMELNIMRQGMAISTGLLAAEVYKRTDLKAKRYIIFGLLVLLAASFHSAAIILILIPVVDKLGFKRKHIFWSVVILTVAFFLYSYLYQITSLFVSLTRDYAEYYESKNYGTGSINAFALYELLVPLVCFAIASWTIVYRQRKMGTVDNDEVYEKNGYFKNCYLMYMVLFLVLCRLLRFRVYIITRMAYYFIPYLWILFPRAITNMRGLNNRRITRALLVCSLLIIFVYVGYTNASSYYGTVPYSFFWE